MISLWRAWSRWARKNDIDPTNVALALGAVLMGMIVLLVGV